MVEATVEELAGYISGNVKRRQIVDVLNKNGVETFDALGKLTRTPKSLLEKSLRDMEEKGVIKKDGDRYSLTENGVAVVNVLQSMR